MDLSFDSGCTLNFTSMPEFCSYLAALLSNCPIWYHVKLFVPNLVNSSDVSGDSGRCSSVRTTSAVVLGGSEQCHWEV